MPNLAESRDEEGRPKEIRRGRCTECDGELTWSKEMYTFGDVELGKLPAQKCQKCGELYFTDEAYDKAMTKARALGLLGVGKVTKIRQSGSSLIVTIPKKVTRFLKLRHGDLLWIHPEGKDKLVFEIRGRGGAPTAPADSTTRTNK